MSSVITPPSSPATSATGELRRPKPLRMLWITAAFGACFVAIQWGLRDAPVLVVRSLARHRGRGGPAGGGGRPAPPGSVRGALVGSDHHPGELDVIVASGWHFVIGGAVLALVAAAVEGAPLIAWTPRFVVVLVFLSVVGSAAAFVAWFTETLHSRLDVLSAWTFLTPVFGIVLAAAVLGERPSGWTAAGVAAVPQAMAVVLRPGPCLDARSLAPRPTS